MKYAVAVLSFFTHENSIKFVDAANSLAAALAAVGQSPEDYQNVESIEYLLNELFDQGMAVSHPVALNEILDGANFSAFPEWKRKIIQWAVDFDITPTDDPDEISSRFNLAMNGKGWRDAIEALATSKEVAEEAIALMEVF